MNIVGCFLEYQGKFVIVLRHAHKPNGDMWGLPAGKVDPGEDNKTAVLRELFEETGYRATDTEIEHLGDYDFGPSDKHYTFATYRLRLQAPYEMVIEDAAHAEYRWVTAEECYALPDLVPDFHELLKIIGFVK
jgi:8-oxo-dGTP pyrophosphatase MutT (NUDIX family)